jgi:hypothetical protein
MAEFTSSLNPKIYSLIPFLSVVNPQPYKKYVSFSYPYPAIHSPVERSL